MRRAFFAAILIACAACRRASAPGDYLYVWAGDSAGTAKDFLAVIDARPLSPRYGAVVSTLSTPMAGTHPHHTEAEMPANGHLLANGFHAGRTFLFDLTNPQQPAILTSFGDLAGFSHPHTYTRLANGHVLATFQYKAEPGDGDPMPAGHSGMSMGGTHTTGGLVEMDERGTVIRSGSAADTTIPDRHIFPYSAIELPGDRALSTTTDMDDADTAATSHWIQLWRLSDLTLLPSIPLPPGPRGKENHWTGEPHLLPDGKSVYIHTFGCGLYLVRDLDAQPVATLVKSFEGLFCGVPILTGHWWLQTVPATHSLLALDVTDPEHPREASSVSFGDDEQPHWIAIDPTGRRVVLSSAGSVGNRIFIVNFDPATGGLSLDQHFRDSASTRPGIAMTGRTWPQGFSGKAIPHGTVFSR